tara:strand:+ start:293 stop:538 length:246 start_codon:yes stop_codon:yes gene_type:complete
MKKTIIHVNQHVIKDNRKNNFTNPVITCKSYNSNEYASSVEILDSSGKIAARVIYSPDKPLSCGAHVWIETTNRINTLTKE